MAKEIAKISQETKDAIRRKSAATLPDNPSEMGWKPNEIKKAFYTATTDKDNSVLAEIDRVVEETNAALAETSTELDESASVKVDEAKEEVKGYTDTAVSESAKAMKEYADEQDGLLGASVEVSLDDDYMVKVVLKNVNGKTLSEKIVYLHSVEEAKDFAVAAYDTAEQNKALIDETNLFIKGYQHAIVVTGYPQLVDKLNAETDMDKYFIGTPIYVGLRGIPDLWISGKSSQHVNYTYQSLDKFLEDLGEPSLSADVGVKIGNYFVLAKEGKVYLSDYAKIDSPANGNLVQWDEEKQALVDSGKSIDNIVEEIGNVNTLLTELNTGKGV